jgi:hypothetical protein
LPAGRKENFVSSSETGAITGPDNSFFRILYYEQSGLAKKPALSHGKMLSPALISRRKKVFFTTLYDPVREAEREDRIRAGGGVSTAIPEVLQC